MKASEDKNLEKFVDKILKDAPLETPSFDFTAKVMSQVLSTSTSDVTVYKPLISKPVLIAILGSIIALIGYLISNGNPQSSRWFDVLDYDSLFNIRLLSDVKFSKITMYAVVLSTVMLFVQIPLLKNYFDKRLEI